MRKLNAIAILAMVLAPALASAGPITNYSSQRPPSMTMPSKGGAYVDPIFGSKIFRVTDASNGTICTHAYSYWRAFNSDSTRLLLKCDNVPLLYRWNASTEKITYDGLLRGSDGYSVQSSGATWSNFFPDTMYALDAKGMRLWRINVAQRGKLGYSLVKDFSSSFSSTVYLNQLHVSNDAMTYTFHTRDRLTGVRLQAVVWDRRNNVTYKFSPPAGYSINETKLNKAGDLAMINWDNDAVTMWAFKTGTKTWLYHDHLADEVSGHFDLGFDFMINTGASAAGLVARVYGDLRNADYFHRYKRVNGAQNWSLCDHLSLRADDEIWAYASTYCGDGKWDAFEDEIFMSKLDGSGFVRLAHSRSKEASSSSSTRYYAQPRAVVDGSGKYIVYTSDLGSTTRTDVMLLKIPSAYWPL